MTSVGIAHAGESPTLTPFWQAWPVYRSQERCRDINPANRTCWAVISGAGEVQEKAENELKQIDNEPVSFGFIPRRVLANSKRIDESPFKRSPEQTLSGGGQAFSLYQNAAPSVSIDSGYAER